MRFSFLLVILVSIQIEASPQIKNPVPQNNQIDFNFDNEDLSWDHSNLIDNITLDALVLDSLSYSPYPQNFKKISDENLNICNEADNLPKQNILNDNPAIALNEEELESNYNEIIYNDVEETFNTSIKPNNLLKRSKRAIASNYQELESNYNEIVYDLDITDITDENIDNLAKDEVENNQPNNSITEQGFEEKLESHANNNLTSTKNSKPIGFAPRAIIDNTNIVMSNIDNRLNSLTRSFGALAAGDEEQNYEFYINPFIGKAIQKETEKTSGYHNTSKGIIIGHDAHLNDSLQLGTNYTKVETKFNFLRYRTITRSNYYSLYGLRTFSNQNIFTSIIGIYGISDIINFNQIKDTHKAYTSVMQVMLGSNYKLFSNMHVKPMLGVKYSKIREASYLEDNLLISNVKERMIEGILGLKLANSHILDLVNITPEIYAFMHKNLRSKIPSTQANIIDNRVLPIYIRKLPLSFSYGAKLSIRMNSIEIGVNYNGTRANKYISHLGSINFKINL